MLSKCSQRKCKDGRKASQLVQCSFHIPPMWEKDHKSRFIKKKNKDEEDKGPFQNGSLLAANLKWAGWLAGPFLSLKLRKKPQTQTHFHLT